jgi:hypothetical protein
MKTDPLPKGAERRRAQSRSPEQKTLLKSLWAQFREPHERPIERASVRGGASDRASGFRGTEVRSETAKGGHKVFDIAGRRGLTGSEVTFNA